MTFRELLVDFLTASRYVKWLETRHHEQRQDYTERLAEKDALLKELRAEVAWLKMQCGTLHAPSMEQPARPPAVPMFSGPDDWQAELNKLYQQEESNGISGSGRKEVHEQAADDGPQSLD